MARRFFPPRPMALVLSDWSPGLWPENALVAHGGGTWRSLRATTEEPSSTVGVYDWAEVAHGGVDGYMTDLPKGSVRLRTLGHGFDAGIAVPDQPAAQTRESDDGGERCHGLVQANDSGDVTIARLRPTRISRFPVAREDGQTAVATLENDGSLHVPAALGDVFYLDPVAYVAGDLDSQILTPPREPGLYPGYYFGAGPFGGILEDHLAINGSGELTGYFIERNFGSANYDIVTNNPAARMTVMWLFNLGGSTVPDPSNVNHPFGYNAYITYYPGGNMNAGVEGVGDIRAQQYTDQSAGIVMSGEGPGSYESGYIVRPHLTPSGEYVFHISINSGDQSPPGWDIQKDPDRFEIPPGAVTFTGL